MPHATAPTVSLQGALGHLIDVQADVSPGKVGTTLVGRPDASLMVGAPVSCCTKQCTGRISAPSYNSLKSTKSAYDAHLAQVFHNWTTLCTFTPALSGDYYLQVRSNVAPGGSTLANTNGNPAIIYSGNTAAAAATGNYNTGTGNNAWNATGIGDPVRLVE